MIEALMAGGPGFATSCVPQKVVFATERWQDVMPELRRMFGEHWREIAVHHDKVPLDVDYAAYDALDNRGALHVLTARKAGLLVGYHVAIVSTHLHYATTLHGITDVYYIAPRHRTGRTGMRMFDAVAEELNKIRRARGAKVMKLFTAVKLHLDQGPLLECLGYAPVERLYAKILED